jgi:hypothetical protein
MAMVKQVLQEVADVVGGGRASFTNGTLFVRCSVEQAIRIETALLQSLKCGIILSRVGDESAFDFI